MENQEVKLLWSSLLAVETALAIADRETAIAEAASG